jgi:hypothetical protein
MATPIEVRTRLDVLEAVVPAALKAHALWEWIQQDEPTKQTLVGVAGLFDLLIGINLSNPEEQSRHLVDSLTRTLEETRQEWASLVAETGT